MKDCHFWRFTSQAQCKSGLRNTTLFEVVNLVLGLKMCMYNKIHKLGKTNSFWKNCNNIPGESCLQKKFKLLLIQFTIVLAKSAWNFLQKHVISYVETVVSEIKDNKPDKTDISIIYFYINSFCIYSTIFVIQGPQSGPTQHQKQRFFIAASSSTEDKIYHHRSSYYPRIVFPRKVLMQNCPNEVLIYILCHFRVIY